MLIILFNNIFKLVRNLKFLSTEKSVDYNSRVGRVGNIILYYTYI